MKEIIAIFENEGLDERTKLLEAAALIKVQLEKLDPSPLFFKDGEVIPDNLLCGIWEGGNGERVGISPEWYQNNGTPIDDSGDDMRYIHTVFKGGTK